MSTNGNGFSVREITARHIIGKSGLGSESASVNPFVGCSHACAYCYAVFMRKFTDHQEPWGRFVDVKTNAADLFPSDYRRMKGRGGLFFGSVTDVYQPLEKKYRLMRRILEFLVEERERASRGEVDDFEGDDRKRHGKGRKVSPTPFLFPEIEEGEGDPDETVPEAVLPSVGLAILTKSDLVLRDLDLLTRLPGISVGFSLAMPDDRARRIFEPGASPLENRFSALEAVHAAGIRTFVFIDPVIPRITPVGRILHRIAGSADSVFGESINLRYGNYHAVLNAIRRYDPALVDPFRRSLNDPDYWRVVKEEFLQGAEKEGIPCEGFHIHRD